MLRANLLWFSLLAVGGGLFAIFVCPYLRDIGHFPICFFALASLAVLFFLWLSPAENEAQVLIIGP